MWEGVPRCDQTWPHPLQYLTLLLHGYTLCCLISFLILSNTAYLHQHGAGYPSNLSQCTASHEVRTTRDQPQSRKADILYRVLVTAMFLESALVHSGLLGYRNVVFFSPWVFKFPPEIWRLATAFLLTGGGFSFIIDLYFSECFLVDTPCCSY